MSIMMQRWCIVVIGIASLFAVLASSIAVFRGGPGASGLAAVKKSVDDLQGEVKKSVDDLKSEVTKRFTTLEGRVATLEDPKTAEADREKKAAAAAADKARKSTEAVVVRKAALGAGAGEGVKESLTARILADGDLRKIEKDAAKKEADDVLDDFFRKSGD